MANTETHKLYNDEVEIIFYPDSHQYREPGERTYLISNTSVTGIISTYGKLEGLKQWAVNVGCDYMDEYLNDIVFGELGDDLQDKLSELVVKIPRSGSQDGFYWTDMRDVRVWSIWKEKTIKDKLTKKFDDEEADDVYQIVREQITLMIDEVSVEEAASLSLAARYRHKKDLEKAASLGDEVHEFAEEFAKRKVAGEEMTADMLEFDDDRALSMANDFLDWVDEHNVEFVEAERLAYSKNHRYVGTFDALAYVDGVLTLIDYKTSKRIYLGHKLQSSGYWNSRQEEADYIGEDIQIEQAMVVRFDKDPEDDTEFTAEDNTWTLTEEHYPLYRKTFLSALETKKGVKEINRLES